MICNYLAKHNKIYETIIIGVKVMLTTSNSKMGKVGKVVICGMKGVGKTAILEQLIYGNITPDSVSPNSSMKPNTH